MIFLIKMHLYFLKSMVSIFRYGRLKLLLGFFVLFYVLCRIYYFVNIDMKIYRISDNISVQTPAYNSTNNARKATVKNERVTLGYILHNNTAQNGPNRNQAVQESLLNENTFKNGKVRNQPAQDGGKPTKYHPDAACNIPVLDPWDETILRYITDTPKANCSNEDIHNFFYLDDNGVLQENKTALIKHGVTSPKCVYNAVLEQRPTDIVLGKAVEFTAPIFIPHQVFVVKCSERRRTIYQFVFANVMWNTDVQREEEIGQESDEQLSIIIIGLDSVSRSNAIRKLPMTYQYLTGNLGMYDFKGYMTVGLNTFPNIVPLFTGEPAELEARHKKTFIWQEEPMKSYVIHYSEDTVNIPKSMNDKFGFQNRPIDYYYRMYDLTMSKVTPIIMDPLGTMGSYKELCYARKDRIQYQIDYFKRFMTKYSKRLKFGYFWNIQLSHDDFNTVGRADGPLYNLLKWMKTNGHMDRAVVFVGSDHGFRLGGASKSHLGRIEHHMPFMTVRIPDVLLEKFPWMSENLRYNTDRLVTAYDMHETMKRVIYRNFSLVESQNVGASRIKRSIFEKIPTKRSCADAGIPGRFCYCHESVAIDTNAPIVETLAEVSIKHINRIIENSPYLCKALELQRITDARIVPSPNNGQANDIPFVRSLESGFHETFGRYTIMFTTSPNDGLFEMMLDYTNDLKVDAITVIGEHVRINPLPHIDAF